MKNINLTQNKVSLVDDDDFDWLNQWKWGFNKKGYAQRTKRYGLRKDNKHKLFQMHREIMKRHNFNLENLEIDHINHNGLDNRKSNLRVVDRATNAKNRKLNSNSKSGIKGVSFCRRLNKWQAEIQIDNKQIYLGVWKSKLGALLARKLAERII